MLLLVDYFKILSRRSTDVLESTSLEHKSSNHNITEDWR